MNNRMRRIKKYSTSALAVTSSSLILLLATSTANSLARPGFQGGPGPLPPGHAIIHVGALAYFFLDGLFYRPGPKGYVVVPAPRGAVIPVLPAGATAVEIDGVLYYSYAGIHYRENADCYTVAQIPVRQADQEIAQGQQVVVNTAQLNVRSGPGMHSPPIDQFPQGTVVEVVAIQP